MPSPNSTLPYPIGVSDTPPHAVFDMNARRATGDSQVPQNIDATHHVLLGMLEDAGITLR
jgi:hypothetical protein